MHARAIVGPPGTSPLGNPMHPRAVVGPPGSGPVGNPVHPRAVVGPPGSGPVGNPVHPRAVVGPPGSGPVGNPVHPRAVVGPPGTPSMDPGTGMPMLRRSWRSHNPVYPTGRDMTQISFASRAAPTSSRVRIPIRMSASVRSQSKTLCVSNQGQGWSVVLNVNGVAKKAYKASVISQKQQYGQIWWRARLAPQADFPDGFDGWLARCGSERLGTMRNPVVANAGRAGRTRLTAPMPTRKCTDESGWSDCISCCTKHHGSVQADHKYCMNRCDIAFPAPPPLDPHPQAVTVGACFPKFDPLEMYQVGRPAPAPNMAYMQAQSQIPTMDPRTGMPRRRGRLWYR